MTIWKKTKWEVQSVEELKTQSPSWSAHLWPTYEQGYNVWYYKKKKKLPVLMLQPFGRGWKKKQTNKWKRSTEQNQRVQNQVIVQTKADLKMCIREY